MKSEPFENADQDIRSKNSVENNFDAELRPITEIDLQVNKRNKLKSAAAGATNVTKSSIVTTSGDNKKSFKIKP